jgi:hypothetical protein
MYQVDPIEMPSFEALYGRQYRMLFFLSQIGESQVFIPEVIRDAEKQVQMVREYEDSPDMTEELCRQE